MLLFLDTEFTDFQDSELISIGLVSECGRHEFYAERTDFDANRCNDFVRSVVLPQLGQSEARPGPVDTADLAVALLAWLTRIHSLDSGSMVLVLYDFDTDFKLLTKALAGLLPEWLCGINIADQINQDSPNIHHALHDAHVLRADWIATRELNL